VTFMVGPGAGQQCKLGNQITIASGMVGVAEGLLYAHKTGLDLDTYLKAISGGAAASFSLSAYAPRILSGDFEPGFFVEHFVKDLGIALQECSRMNLALPGLALAHQLYLSLKAIGHSKSGTQALVLALENINNARLPRPEGK